MSRLGASEDLLAKICANIYAAKEAMASIDDYAAAAAEDEGKLVHATCI